MRITVKGRISRGAANPGAARAHFFTFFAGDGPLEWVRPIPKAPERSWHASGPSFSPNGRFWTRFGSFLMIWARTDILGGTWTSRTRPGTGREAQDQARDWPGGPGPAHTFFFPTNKKNAGLFLFSEGGRLPPRPAGKSRTFIFY